MGNVFPLPVMPRVSDTNMPVFPNRIPLPPCMGRNSALGVIPTARLACTCDKRREEKKEGKEERRKEGGMEGGLRGSTRVAGGGGGVPGRMRAAGSVQVAGDRVGGGHCPESTLAAEPSSLQPLRAPWVIAAGLRFPGSRSCWCICKRAWVCRCFPHPDLCVIGQDARSPEISRFLLLQRLEPQPLRFHHSPRPLLFF
jgi:hypothetical protein